MTALIKKLYASDVVRYVFFGGCTTLVNLQDLFELLPGAEEKSSPNSPV